MQPGLVVIGLNHRSAPVEVRERFWVGDNHLSEVLHELAASRAVEEAVVLATCNRTEFILWANDTAEAVAAVKALLAHEYAMAPGEWQHFYRLEGDEALRHIFRVAASLDSMVVGEPEITGQVKSAWSKAQRAGTTGRFLDAVFQKAFSVAKRVRNDTPIGSLAVSVPYAAVQLARQIFGRLQDRKVLILGTGKMGELSARYLVSSGVTAIWVASRTYENALGLAEKLGGKAVPFEERWQHLADADIVIGSTGCPHAIVTREDAERIHQSRQGRPVFFVDIAVPRDIDPAAREVPGVFLYDIDDLERVVAQNLSERQAAAREAEDIVTAEAQAFRRKLAAEHVVPTIVAVRGRLEEIRRQELERYRADFGPLNAAEEQALEALTARLVQRIASQLARELRQLPERSEQEQLTAAVRRLFGLVDRTSASKDSDCESSLPVLAGTN